MAVMKYALPLLAVAGSALAQECPTGPTVTVQNSGDAHAFDPCTTYSGDIVIASGTSDSLDFGGLQAIDGSFTAINVTELTTITANSVQEITQDFHLESLTVLTSLSFQSLGTVGNMQWITLPNLQGLSFGDPGVTEADSVRISDTQLSSLRGINLTTVNSLSITENRYLKELTLQLKHINQSLFITGNVEDLTVSLPSLETAFNMTFQNVSSINLDSLQATNASISVGGSGMKTLSANNISYINQSLSLMDNEQLTNVSMPKLIQIGGGFTLAHNPEYLNMDGFPNLKTVGGAVDINGNFTNVTLPALADVRGTFNLQSTANIDDSCSVFRGLSGEENSAIKGKLTCAGSQARPGGSGTNPTGSSSSASASSAAGALDVSSNAALGLTGVLAAMIGLL
ncbi:MAG: hypothetical protein M1820_004292 [Bogoriella megaspora]|nr:MAG: hypothetical protein M1820_004292 [Bogoriella megaspora]